MAGEPHLIDYDASPFISWNFKLFSPLALWLVMWKDADVSQLCRNLLTHKMERAALRFPWHQLEFLSSHVLMLFTIGKMNIVWARENIDILHSTAMDVPLLYSWLSSLEPKGVESKISASKYFCPGLGYFPCKNLETRNSILFQGFRFRTVHCWNFPKSQNVTFLFFWTSPEI